MTEEYFPEVVTLCGSTKFKDEFNEINRNLTMEGKIVISVAWFGHADNNKPTFEEKKLLDEIHLRKIDLADSVFVIDVNGYIGDSTKKEIEYARSQGKKIKYYSKGHHE